MKMISLLKRSFTQLLMNRIVIHYSEIGLKGKNRDFFEKKLMNNIRHSLGWLNADVRRLHGRIVIDYSGKNSQKYEDKLKEIPGISNFSFALESGLELKDIRKVIDTLAKKQIGETFAVSTARSNKAYKITSQEINEIIGDHIREKYELGVNLRNPDTTYFIEITDKTVFLFNKKIKGIGGLPVTSSGKLVCLVSGGIDSPVAAFKMMKRGCSIVFVHFHNWSKDQDIVKDKVEKIVKRLSAYQPKTKLYMVPFENLQKNIILKVPARFRMIIYRRIMFEIANAILEKEKALGLVTGDSVGQVASQTLENLNSIYSSAKFPVYSPLIGYDKEEIIDLAKKVGTYELSIMPYSDCCSFLIAKHPETRSRLGEIEQIESAIDVEKLSQKALSEAEVKNIY